MATVVLTAVGTVLGGPIGGALGALAGSAIDSQLFASSGASKGGPRLAELAVQTSSYGTAIPQILGRMRVAGTVIWATDLRESTAQSGGGKGRQGTTSYSYSVSLAVAVSSRPIAAIGRIWADGTLLRGEAGDLKVDCQLRMHSGDGAQQPDALIASAEGPSRVPGHRGLAYVVLEDLQLADYGNHIPSLTFEVIERSGPLPVAAIAEAAGASSDVAAPKALTGYALSGRDARSVLADFAAGAGLTLRAEAFDVILGDHIAAPGPDIVAIVDTDGRPASPPSLQRAPASSVPRRLDLRFYDVGAEYQAGLASAERVGAGQRSIVKEWPAALTAEQAQDFAAGSLLNLQSGRETASLTTLTVEGLVPGSCVTIAGQPGNWTVRSIERARITCRVECVRNRISGLSRIAATRRTVSEIDLPPGRTTLALIELPCTGPDLARAPIVIAAATGSPGWRGAGLWRIFGDARMPIGSIGRPVALGRVVSPPAATLAPLLDSLSQLEIALPPQFMLVDADSDALRAGANVAMIGREMIQFARALPLGEGHWRLSGLFRGLAATDGWIAGHVFDEPFLLIERDRPAAIDAPAPLIGETLAIEASGIGDTNVVGAALTVVGQAIRPPSPVHVTLSRVVDGWTLDWKRRGRLDGGWQDWMDAALTEDGERYEIRLLASSGTAMDMRFVSDPVLSLVDAELVGISSIEIRQFGRDGQSAPATIAIAN